MPAGLMGKKVGRYESVIERHVGVFVSRVTGGLVESKTKAKTKSKQHTSKGLNIAPAVHRFTLDTMLELIWGPIVSSSNPPFTDSAIAGDITNAFRTMSKTSWACSLLPTFGWIMSTRPIDALLRKPSYNKANALTGLWGLVAAARKLVFSYPDKAVCETQPSIVKSWLEVPLDDPANRMSQAQIWSEAFNLMIAGPGSTAAALTAVLYRLGTDEGRAWQVGLREQLSRGCDGSASPKLNAVIKETLRLHAPFPTAFPRVINPGAESIIPTLSDPVPVGTTVSANTYVLGRSTEIWGDDAEEWLPQRWLGDETHRREMEGNLVAFSRGSRSCLGKDLAMLVIAKATVEVIRRGLFRSVGELKGRSHLEMQYDWCCLVDESSGS